MINMKPHQTTWKVTYQLLLPLPPMSFKAQNPEYHHRVTYAVLRNPAGSHYNPKPQMDVNLRVCAWGGWGEGVVGGSGRNWPLWRRGDQENSFALRSILLLTTWFSFFHFVHFLGLYFLLTVYDDIFSLFYFYFFIFHSLFTKIRSFIYIFHEGDKMDASVKLRIKMETWGMHTGEVNIKTRDLIILGGIVEVLLLTWRKWM